MSWRKVVLGMGLLVLFSGAAAAKVWLLPDYQSQQQYSHRTNGGDSRPADKVSCSTYGMLTASEVGTGMACKTSKMIKDVKCYGDCTCSSSYRYTATTCRSAGKIPSGAACMGKYPECVCDTSLYPHTSSSCAYTLSGSPCSDSLGYHYPKCVNPCAAYGSYTNTSSCPYGCETTVSSCPSKCQKCYADNCRNRTAVATPHGCEKYFNDCSSKCEKAYADNCRNRTAVTDCKYGCASNFGDCPAKCEACKTCAPVDCSAYSATSASNASSYTTCVVGCGDSITRYKITSCKSGYTLSGNSCTACNFGSYTLSSCPSGGSCTSTFCGGVTKYMLNSCSSCYTKSGSSCVANACAGYNLSSCPANASCSSCCSGATTKYRVTGCAYNYVLSGGSCIYDSCAVEARKYYLQATVGKCGSSSSCLNFTLNGTACHYVLSLDTPCTDKTGDKPHNFPFNPGSNPVPSSFNSAIMSACDRGGYDYYDYIARIPGSSQICARCS